VIFLVDFQTGELAMASGNGQIVENSVNEFLSAVNWAAFAPIGGDGPGVVNVDAVPDPPGWRTVTEGKVIAHDHIWGRCRDGWEIAGIHAEGHNVAAYKRVIRTIAI
jgi:hypothetical protein